MIFGHDDSVIIGDGDSRGGERAQGGAAAGGEEGDGEGFGGLDQPVVQDGEDDILGGGVAAGPSHNIGGGAVIQAGGGRAVGGAVVARDGVAAAAGAEGDESDRAGGFTDGVGGLGELNGAGTGRRVCRPAPVREEAGQYEQCDEHPMAKAWEATLPGHGGGRVFGFHDDG